MMRTARSDQSLVFRFGDIQLDFGARTHVIGILNVTPDSFSDGGVYRDAGAAVERAIRMAEEGADIIDVGGESSRPRSSAYGEGAAPVTAEEELRRVLPVVERLARECPVPVSVDTTKAQVAARVLEAGATIINDISAFRFDEAMAGVIARSGGTAIVMHMQGSPQTMQQNPVYTDLLGDVTAFLRTAVERGRTAGIRQIVVDPGIGFGKRLNDNLELLRSLSRFHTLGCPVLVGPSRKMFLGDILDLPVDDRLEGTIAACVAAILSGAHLIRVHDVQQVRRAARVADALRAPA